METLKERIMLVESDPEVSELIARQTLRPLGYQVEEIESASTAIKELENISPDLIITDLALPGISGKDLLVALSSQGINLPIIVITPRGHENDALQAFRLGAMNFLTYPLREAEVVNVVEDTLRQFRKRNELENYARQLDQIKERLEQHINDLVEIFSIGKLVPSAVNQQALYEKVINTSAKVTKADSAWMTVLDFQKNKYILRACLEVDETVQSRLNLPYEDSLTSLVAVSGQTVAVHAEALKSFNLPGVMEASLVMPIKWKDEAVGVLAVSRKTTEPFTSDQQAVLEMIADYTSSLIENARRFQILEQRLFLQQQSSLYTTIDANLKTDLLHQASLELRNPLKSLLENLDLFMNQDDRRLSHRHTVALNIIQEEADILVDIADSMVRIQQRESSKVIEEIDLSELVRDVVNRYLAIAQVSRISLKLELPATPANVMVFSSQITRVIEGLISNALKYSPTKSQIFIRVEKKADRTILAVKDQGSGIDANQADQFFDKKSRPFGEEARRFGGIGISLPMIKEIISAHKGELWIESGQGKGFTALFSLPQ
jgi:signal transduction histidine kinase/FixJ family two-component response regulator